MIPVSPTVYTVTQLNQYTKGVLEGDENLRHLFVCGEISNFKAHFSGHYYLTLKDRDSTIKAVMFKSNAARLRFLPENGMQVLCLGTVTLYERDGAYQLYISDMQPDGSGALQVAFEQLKRKLAQEGLFDAAKKRALPRFPKRVGVITAKTGAAVHDIIDVLGRRFPAAEVVLCPVQVQGEAAAGEIATAIRLMNRKKAADVLIVGRGGGSVEDLWAFNEEIVARAVRDSRIPVISAVGHETDVTICDFAADLRAPTPSAAAELAVPDSAALENELSALRRHMESAMRALLFEKREQLSVLRETAAMRNPGVVVQNNMQRVTNLGERLLRSMNASYEREQARLCLLAGKLNALSPLSVVSRGYGIVYRGDTPISGVKQLQTGEEITIRMNGGRLTATVTKREDENGTAI